MATIDFSNATLETGNYSDILGMSYLGFTAYMPINCTGVSMSRTRKSAKVWEFNYIGRTTGAGNQLAIYNSSGGLSTIYTTWIIKNIQFAAGDQFNFTIQVELP